ncbi:MAG TPA: CpsD/CapB family tyrosine-protein kinase [Candidatus Tectomicrobia bacterium]|nr:CpsD/CapB family tyrosine-protein kinase [Candidatus Tectomicrobia bacterium]
MSRTYEALKRAERGRRNGAGSGPVPAGPAPVAATEVEGTRVAYERLRVWITSPPPGDDGAEHGIQTVLVVGCHARSGATTVATRLASTLAAKTDARVLLVDANLRRPCLDRVFGLPAGPGLRQALNGSGPAVREQPTASPNLFVLTAGHDLRDAGDVLDSHDVERLLAHLRPRFDHIIVDTAPLLDFPDAYALARNVDAVVLVVEAERTPVDTARRIAQDLRHLGTQRIGVVLNRQRDYIPRFLRRLVSSVAS